MRFVDRLGIFCRRFLPTLCGVALVLCFGTVNEAEAPVELEMLFSKVQMASGEKYLEIRNALLRTEMDLETFLKEKQRTAESVDVRWLAEILLDRREHRLEFQMLEQEFHENVLRYFRDYPDQTRGKTDQPGNWSGLLIPDEPLPVGPMELELNRAPNPLLKEFAEQEREFWKSLRISKSPHWPHLLAEIVMKGWHSDANQPLGTDGHSKPLSDVEYQNQALRLLGKLGEERIAPWAIRIVEDSKRDVGYRATSATCLGDLKSVEGLPALLKVCESSGDGAGGMMVIARDYEADELPERLFQAICKAMVNVGDPRIVPEMQRISVLLKSKAIVRNRSLVGKIADPAVRSRMIEWAAKDLQNLRP